MIENTYLLPVWDSIESAWKKTYGCKSSFWGALTLFFIIAIAFGITEGILEALEQNKTLITVVNVLSYIINYLLTLGLMFMGIKRANGQPVTYDMIFSTFSPSLLGRIIALYFLQILAVIAFAILCFLPPTILLYTMNMIFHAKSVGMNILAIALYVIAVIGMIYLCMRLILAVAFLLDQNSGPWTALKQSFRATRGNVLRIIAVMFLEFCIILLSMIPLLIGTIWTIPFSYVLYGEIYKTLALNARK
jgi:hypothetical protein